MLLGNCDSDRCVDLADRRLPMRAINIHALSITALALTNVILAVQNVRWLIYAQPIRTQLPYGHLSYRFDPILEAPAILFGLCIAYLLVYKISLNIWRIRQSEFQHAIMTRALSLNSSVLLVLTGLGIAQWLVFFGYVAGRTSSRHIAIPGKATAQ